MVRACIICGEKKDGLRVKNDGIINAIRWLKHNITRNERGYDLVVCKECFLKYREAKTKYDHRRIIYVGIGVIFTLLLLLLSGGRSIGALISGIVLIGLMYLLSLLSYMPSLEIPKTETKRAKAGRKIGI